MSLLYLFLLSSQSLHTRFDSFCSPPFAPHLPFFHHVNLLTSPSFLYPDRLTQVHIQLQNIQFERKVKTKWIFQREYSLSRVHSSPIIIQFVLSEKKRKRIHIFTYYMISHINVIDICLHSCFNPLRSLFFLIPKKNLAIPCFSWITNLK